MFSTVAIGVEASDKMLTGIGHDHISPNISRSNHSRFHPMATNLTGRTRMIQNLPRALKLPLPVTSVMFYIFIYPTHSRMKVNLPVKFSPPSSNRRNTGRLSIVLQVLVLPIPRSSREGWIGTKDNRANGGN